ncbi:hypothetical protein KKC13_01775 [bacterium]|nr:hypothetical protein [bacterium]MBU1957604.1 hypothetical protein [bacterium]
MQINFTPKKIKAAKAYVDRLTPVDVVKIEKKTKEPKGSFLKSILKFLFK